MSTFKIYRLVMLVIIAVIYFFVCLHRHSPTVMARDLIQALNIDAVVMGVIASAYFYCYSGMQPVVGFLTDSKGPRKVMALFFLVSAIGTFVFSIAPNAATAITGRILIGAGLAGVFVPALKIFSRWYPADRFASLSGFMITIGGIGGIAASAPLSYLVVSLGWRGSLAAIGVFSVIMAVAAWIILRDTPEDKGWPAVTIEADPPAKGIEESSLKQKLAILFGNMNFCLVCLAVFLLWGAALSFQGLWAFPYLMDVFGVDKVKAGWLFIAWPLGFGIGGFVIGFLSDRFHLNRKNTLLTGLAMNIAQWFFLIFFDSREYMLITVPLFFLFGLVGGGSLPLCFSITRDLFPFQLMGAATGFMNCASFLSSTIYMPFTGFLLKAASQSPAGSYSFAAYRLLFIVFILSYAGAFIAVAMLGSKTTPQQARN